MNSTIWLVTYVATSDAAKIEYLQRAFVVAKSFDSALREFHRVVEGGTVISLAPVQEHVTKVIVAADSEGEV